MSNKTVCIVGSEGGIGSALRARLAKRSPEWRCLSMDVSAPIPIDLSQPQSVAPAFAQARTQAEHLDALVITSGVLDLGKLSSLDPAQWNRVLAINLTGPFLCCREAVGWLRDGGRIVMLSSLAGRTGGVLTGTAYAVSKGGVESLVKSVAQELAPRGITVNGVAPGGVDTPMVRRNPPDSVRALEQATPLKRLAQADEIAAAIAFLMSEDAGYITGEILSVNGGLRMD